MKQRSILCMILLIVLLFCGCTRQTPPETTEAAKPESEATGITGETEKTSPTEASEENKHPDVIDCVSAEGIITAAGKDSNTPCQIYLKKYRNDEPAYISYDLHIEINTGSQMLKKVLSTYVLPLPDINTYFADVDGDGIQEILIHHNTGGCGGAGLYQTWVLKVEGNEIRILFENFNEFDTGFESRFLDGYKMEVKNKFTGYTLVFDVKDQYGSYIDANGGPPDGSIILDPFYVFEPTDTDNDGISEIFCKQYTSYHSHTDYTGMACSVLKFNKQTQVFEVINAWYEPYTEPNTEQ